MRSSSIRAGSKSNDKGPCKRQKREDTGRDGNDVATSQGSQGCGSKPPAAGRGEGDSTPDSLQRNLALLTPRFWTSGLQNCERINFSLFF